MSKIINENRKGYKKTNLGWIPQEWDVKNFSDCCENDGKYGINAPAVEFQKELPTYLRITDIDENGKFIESDKKSVDRDNYKEFILKEGDIVFARTGATVGKTYLYNNYDGILVYAGFLIKFHPITDILVPYFIKTFTDSYLYWKWVKKICMRSGQPGINSVEYGTLNILVPTIEEQKIISTIFYKCDRIIELTNKLIKLKEKRKKALMQQLLTGKKRLKGFNGKWNKLDAGSIFKNHSEKGFKNETLLSVTQDKGVIPRDMLEIKVTMPSGEINSFKFVEQGDFVISLRSFQGGLEYSNFRGVVSPAYTVLKPLKKINDNFYKYYFKSYDFISHLSIAVIGIRDGKQVSFDDFCLVKIPFPSYEEQKAISNVLLSADKEIELLKRKLELLKKQKKGLMQVLLTGKIRVINL